MTVQEVRNAYFEFFKKRGHTRIPSQTLIPENDPTTLFVSSGMQPLVPFLLGKPHPEGDRLMNAQRSFRADDIEEVGDNRHTTFFEMLGNWSLGSYFKEEQLSWFFSFLTDELKLDPKRIYVTVFAGDDTYNIPRDDASVAIWKKLFASKGIEAKDVYIGTEEAGYKEGMQGGRIFYYDAKKNWWSRGGVPGTMPIGDPAGPDSEVFYDFGEAFADPAFRDKHEHPNSDSGRFVEIGNSVFMEYVKKDEHTFAALPQKNVDFGGGLERLTAATRNNPDVFLIDVFDGGRKLIEELSHTMYTDTVYQASYRVLLDHLRAATFMIADGVVPTNSDAGYIARRLLRRAVRHADIVGLPQNSLARIAATFIPPYEAQYSALKQQSKHIYDTINAEEEKFRTTLTKGLRQFDKLGDRDISGSDAFILFTTYGFPVELTVELAREKGHRVDLAAYEEELTRHREASRKGAEKKFKGGLGDTSKMSVRYHTATHLLHQALRDVLGTSVEQRGSNITPERLRFDFTFPRKMTDDEKQRVAALVNEKIRDALPVTYKDMSLAEARKLGAIGLFGEKYGDTVRVYQIGDYSLEFCGGPHVTNTSELGEFVLVKESSVGSGVRRIKAVLK